MGLDIEGVLREHAMIWGDIGMHGYECVCGITDEDDRRWTESDYYAHVAAVLREQIAAAQAEAWDEALFAVCVDNGIVYDIGMRPTNPYRAALVAPSRVPGEESCHCDRTESALVQCPIHRVPGEST